MAGEYTCVSAYTNVPMNASVVLDTFIAITWSNANENQFATKGKDFKVMCEVTAEPSPSVDWFKEGTPISTGERYVIHTNGLMIKNIEESDDGTYTCRAVVIQTGELAERNIKLEVYTAPEMEERESRVEIKEGGSAAITCKARGKPAPTYSWIKASTRENLASTSRFSVNEITGLLTFDRVEAGDYGKYICSAVNQAGQNETEIEVEVLVPPKIFELKNMTVAEKVEGRLECKATGRPAPRIRFRKLSNTEPFVNGPNDDGRFHEYDLVETPQVRIFGAGPYSHVLVTPTDRSLYGVYKCIATNRHGEAVHTTQLREASVPGTVVQARQETLTATSVSFNIVGPAEEMNPPVRAFATQYKESENFDWNFAMNRTWSVNSPYVVENLKPMASYDFRFAAVNIVGAGSWGAPITVIMPRRSPPEKPKWREEPASPETLIHGKYADRYELQWRVPAHNGEPIDMYEVSYCPVLKVSGEWRVGSDSQCFTEEIKSYETINYEVIGLHPDTRYRMQVRAHNILGFSNPAHLYVQTALGVTFSGYAPPQLLSSGAIIGLALAGVFICLLIVDLLLFCFRRQGVIASICGKRAKKHKDDEAKLGSLYGWRFPLPYCSTKPRAPPSPAPLPPPVKLVPTPTDEKEPLKDTGDDALKRNSSVEFDGRRVYATSGGPIIGKNSAV
ncbi:hypothetical protein MSG28_004737 [Choristoneura fumiferana]|uniref:Uncharacterized protein n=1 Tax=Choristoneura fumiferana TaxID=7141 RepID=A0ACC0K793_CHOFU|nr:hypothetical protein MSG28_004737 [Choristoneura fumiferana]